MITIGVDEVGRGPLVGNVVAAAVVLDGSSPERNLGKNEVELAQLDDSKKLSPKKREYLYHQLVKSTDYAVAQASPTEIDSLNIHHASLLAMRRAIEKIMLMTSHSQVTIIVDGKYVPIIENAEIVHRISNIEAVIKADSLFPCVSAASIIAKVTRDWQMDELHQRHPQYGFSQHRGYPTKQHKVAILHYGILSEHRKSFRGVNN